jgi:flagellum-specific peptidoglycan hydrolase FlgJ
MIASAITGLLKTGVEKVTGTIKHKNELKFKAQEMQFSYLKSKMSTWLFAYMVITATLPWNFWILSPILKYIPFMTEVLNDYEKILNAIGIDRQFSIILTLLGMGGLAATAGVVGKVKMAAKKADNDAAIQKEKIRRGVIGDDFVNIEAKSDKKKVIEFVKKYGPLAEEIEKRYKLPAVGVLAHAALESGWGEKILTGFLVPSKTKIGTNNIFNIKKSSTWTGKVAARKVWEVKEGEDVTEKHFFKVYRSIEESFNDYAVLLTTKERYKDVVGTKTAEEYGQALYDAGYMTDDKAPGKIKKISEMFNYET